MNPNEHGQPLTDAEPEAAPVYRIIWMGKDGEYEQRHYLADEVTIGTQDQSFVVMTQHVTRPLVLLLVPVQRVVHVEMVQT